MVGAAVRGRGRKGRDLLPIAGRVVDADATGRIGTADIPAGVKRRPAVKNRILYLKQEKIRAVDVVSKHIVRAGEVKDARSNVRIEARRALAFEVFVVVANLEQGPAVFVHLVCAVKRAQQQLFAILSRVVHHRT